MSDPVRLSGTLTLDTVSSQINALDATLAQGAASVDFSGVTATDSSAVALLLEWSRRARARGVSLQLHAVPDSLRSLIAVYGLTELLLPD